MVKSSREKTIYVILAFFSSIYVEMMLERKTLFISGQFTGFLNNSFQLNMFLHMIPVFIISLGLMLILEKNKGILEFADKHRYAIGLIIIVVCTLLELSGSSISYWHEYLKGPYTSREEMWSAGILAGIPRARSDEFGVFTPFNISQAYTGYKNVSNIIRGSLTDVTTAYGSPCFALVTIFRPFFWGYLLLGSAKGLAFYWISRLVVLFLVSYEFGKLVFDENKSVAATFSVMVTFSQTIQWWYSINGLVEMFIFGQLGVVLVHKLFNTNKLWKKLLICLGIIECAGGYAFTYYPAQEVPLVYVFGVMLIWVFIVNRNQIRKQDILLLIASVLVFAALAAAIVYSSKDTFELIMNTVYPGDRANTGGSVKIGQLFYWIVSIFSPIDELGVGATAGGNMCESACFFSLFPVGIVLSVIGMIKKKKADFMKIALICVEVLFVAFCVVGLPLPIAKLTLLSNAIPNRVLAILGFMDLILLGSYIIDNPAKEEGKGLKKILGIVAIILGAIVAVLFLHSVDCVTNKMIWMLTILVLVLVMYLLFFSRGGYRGLCSALVVITLLSGICINPLQKGIDVVTEDELIKTIRNITEEEPDSVWITTETLLNDFPLIAGARTINSVNVYPNLEMWKKVDPKEQYVDIYNRYAHIIIWFTSEDTIFELAQPDCFRVYLNVDDLHTLGVNYVVSPSYYESDKMDMVYQGAKYYIYKVK